MSRKKNQNLLLCISSTAWKLGDGMIQRAKWKQRINSPRIFLQAHAFITCATFHPLWFCHSRSKTYPPTFGRHMLYTYTVSWRVPNIVTELEKWRNVCFSKSLMTVMRRSGTKPLKLSTFLSLLAVFTKPSKPGVWPAKTPVQQPRPAAASL